MMSFKEFKSTVCTPKVAGPHKESNTTETSTTATTSSTTTTISSSSSSRSTLTNKSDSTKDHNTTSFCMATTSTVPTSSSSTTSLSTSSSPSLATTVQGGVEVHMKLCKLFTFIDDTYRELRCYNTGLRKKDSYNTQLMQTINKYKIGCNEIYSKVLESYDLSLKLSQNIIRTIDIFKELSTSFTDLEEYQYRICEIMSIFIVCELRLSVEIDPQDHLTIAQRIIYIMRRHLVQEEEHETIYNILRTLVYIPKLFNARDIMCAIFGEFIPIKPVPMVNVLPDKLYMLYIIVFYRWMMMQKDNDDKLLIVNFAESFMKPAVSLCSNNLYGSYLPMYTTHSTATRTILNNLKYYRDIRNACMIDNALNKSGSVVNLCDDEDDDIIVLDTSSATDFAQSYAVVINMEPLTNSLSHIKLEEKTVVGLVDLTEDDETTTNASYSLIERHDKWLNEFQQLAKQSRESQLLLEKQQNQNQMISQAAVICLDSDSEADEEEEQQNRTQNTSQTPAQLCNKTLVSTTTETTAKRTHTEPALTNQCEDLFVDSYPLTQTPINCDTDLESLNVEEADAEDVTKISSRFLSANLRTYQVKKSNNNIDTEERNIADCEQVTQANKSSTDNAMAYRRDSIHISSTPPENADNDDDDEDDGTDVQDEHDDDLLEEDTVEEEANAYTFLPTTPKKSEKDVVFAKQIKPMGLYPTYNSLHGSNSSCDKVIFSQTLQHYRQQKHDQQHQHDKQCFSDSWDAKSNKKQKKKVQFNTNLLGPTTTNSNLSMKVPLKPSLQQSKYKLSDAPEYFHLRGFERFSMAPSIAGSTSTSASNSTTSSIIKHQEQQEHLAAAATLFRNIFDRTRYPYAGSFSPTTSSSLSSRSLNSPATIQQTPSTSRKKTRLQKTKKQNIKQRRKTLGTRDELNSTNSSTLQPEEHFSIIRNREDIYNSKPPRIGGGVGGGPPGMPSYGYSSDDGYGIASDSEMFINERYKNDAKLRKRCAVVITPTKELIQYERKRDQMYNEILQKQRRKLELRALEKQKEKERARRRLCKTKMELDNKEKSKEELSLAERDKDKVLRRRGRSQPEIIMSSESEIETNFQVRTRKQRLQNVKDLQQPLNIQIGMNEVTNSLISQIDAHLEKPTTKKPTTLSGSLKQGKQLKEKRLEEQIINEQQQQQSCDIKDKSLQQQTKLKEINILNDIAQHLSPYQLDLPETNSSSNSNISNTTAANTSMLNKIETRRTMAKEKVTVTEHLILQTFDNLIEKTPTQLENKKEQQQETLNSEAQQHQEQQRELTSAVDGYAHEPKLNIATILNSTSPLESQDHNARNENSEEDQNNTEEILKANMPSDEALEQILEESISVLKSVTSPFNECPGAGEATNTATSIPLLISNVESLNHFETNQSLHKNKQQTETENLIQNGEANKEIVEQEIQHNQTKDNAQEDKQQQQLSSTLINPAETTIMCESGLTHINVETHITNALKVTPLMPADLSDISLESEISKHLPDIAEPSPVVTTDMSDNSNASDVSRPFSLQPNTQMQPVANNANVETLPLLPLTMPNLANANNEANLEAPGEQPATNVVGESFLQDNSCLNTPTKCNTLNRDTQNTNDLNNSLKFLPQTDLGEEKNSLETEADSNVTKFLDLILNKTVSDAESETRDKIIKELNALTAGATANSKELADEQEQNIENEEADTTANDTQEENQDKDILDVNPLEVIEHENKVEETKTHLDTTVINEGKVIDKTKTLEIETEKQIHLNGAIETAIETSKEAIKEAENLNLEVKDKAYALLPTNDSRLEQKEEEKSTEAAKEILKENFNSTKDKDEEKILYDNKENKVDNPENSLNTKEASQQVTTNNFKISPGKLKIKHLKNKLNIKCRVRLKRLHIDEQIKTWIAINPTSENPTNQNQDVETSAINNSKDLNCDITTTDCNTASTATTCNIMLKKPCLKLSQKRFSEDVKEASNKTSTTQDCVVASKKLKLEVLEKCEIRENNNSTTPTAIGESKSNELLMDTSNCSNSTVATPSSSSSSTSNSTATKTKSKVMKTVTFDLSNLNEDSRNTPTFTREKKMHRSHAASIAGGAMGCYLKTSRQPRKLPDNTLRAAETLQIFVNTLNDSNRTPPSAEFNKKRSPIKNKCIAEDETPRPPAAATLMGAQPCKKACTDKTRSQITTSSSSSSSSKCKDQLVSSLATPPTISNISSDITTARIYTSSPLDQTLPEYDDNVVDTVADTELILPTTTGSLRRKLKRPKKSLARPLPVDDISTDDISNQPECNGEDDTDAVVDNEDDVFVEELLPIPAANEHILEEIVSARPTHMGPGSIRDDYMNIEATATVPVYLFNDESRDLATPEPIQSSDTTNVVDSSSYLNTTSTTAANNNLGATAASTTTQHLGNLEKSMLSPSEHEVSSTQETFYQTPTKSKQTETFGDKSSSNNKEKTNNNSSISFSASQKLKSDESNFQSKEEMETSSTTGLLQNNQVDTTNHSPEMCTLSLTPPTNTMTTSSSSSNSASSNNRKIRKVSTHDEILYNELQQQTSSKRKNLNNHNTTTSCAESTSGDNATNSLDDNINNKTNGSLFKVEDKFKKLLKEVCKRDKSSLGNELNVTELTAENTLGPGAGGGGATTGDSGGCGGGGGSSPSTTTIINEEKLYRSKRKKQKSSKSSKCKNHPERSSSKIVLKASKLAAHIPANPLIITIPKSRLLRPPPTPTPPSQLESQNELLQQQQDNEFLDIPNAKLFIEKDKTTTTSTAVAMSSTSSLKRNSQNLMQHHRNSIHHHDSTNKPEQTAHAGPAVKTKRTLSPANTTTTEMQVNKKTNRNTEPSINNKKQEQQQQQQHTINATSTINTNKEKSCLSLTKKKTKTSSSNSSSSSNINATKASSSSSSANTANSSTNNNKVNTCSSSSSSSSNTSTNNIKNNSNTNLIFVKDKYDLIKTKDKHQYNQNNSGVGGSTTITEASEYKEKLKDFKNGGQSSTTTTSASTSSTTRSHKTLSKDKNKTTEKIQKKFKQKLTNDKDYTGKMNSNEIISKTLTNSTTTTSRNKTNNSSKTKSFTSTSSTTANPVLKTKSNNSTTAANNTPQPLSNSSNKNANTASSGSSSASVTISNNHVRKKLKTK